MKKPLLFLLFIVAQISVWAQSINLPLLETYRISAESKLYAPEGEQIFFTSVKPYLKQETDLILGVDGENIFQRKDTSFSKKWKNQVWNRLWNEHLIDISGKDYRFWIDPLFLFEGGHSSQRAHNSSQTTKTWQNTRGFRVEGFLGERFGFSSSFFENQALFPPYLKQHILQSQIINGEQYRRKFKNDGFDWYWAEAYISYSAPRFFNIQFGHNKNFFGDGYRSLLLSDNSTPYLNLKIQTQFWRIKYVNLWAQLQDLNRANPSNAFLKKWSSTHYLSWQVTKRWSLSLFESIVWDNGRSKDAVYRGFDVSYLNPIIFYRAVEFNLGSPDNVLIGMNSSFRIGEQHILYGQLILDEFKLKEMKSGNGWWANKYGFQLGYKNYAFIGIPNLFFQVEYNQVRPYTYSHRYSTESYGNLGEPLAHPSGANFRELLLRSVYQYDRFVLEYKCVYLMYGADKDKKNYGHNIFASYNSRPHEYGNFTGQGDKTTVFYNNIRLSYLINPSYNSNIYLGYEFRKKHIASLKEKNPTDNHWIYFGFSTSLRNFYRDFF